MDVRNARLWMVMLEVSSLKSEMKKNVRVEPLIHNKSAATYSIHLNLNHYIFVI